MQRRMLKGIALLSMMSSLMPVHAVDPGFYIGLMGGPATNGGGSQNIQTANPPPAVTPGKPKNNQFGTRVYMGYKMNPYAGVEAGFTYFSQIKYTTDDNVDPCGSAKVSYKDFDVVGRGSMPLGSFELFGKAGIAAVDENKSGPLNPNTQKACGQSSNTVGFRPTVSLGVSYNLSQSVVTDISWNRTQVGGIVNSMDFYALGLSYHFVDVYCGQFLC